MEEITINGEIFVKKSDVQKMADKLNDMEYCIVRTYSAGVFAGYVESRTGKDCVIRAARRIWYWDGAATLSQLAVDGTNKPENCKFPCPVDKVTVTEAIEIIPCTAKAKESIEGVPVWEV